MTIEQTRQFCNERKKAKMNSCFFCKNGTVEHSVTTYMVDLKTCIVIIKNVPCEECTQCGEKYFTDSVMEKLEAIVKKSPRFCKRGVRHRLCKACGIITANSKKRVWHRVQTVPNTAVACGATTPATQRHFA